MKAKTKDAYVEVLGILDLLDEEQKNRIPKKLKEFFENNKNQDYQVNIDSNKMLANGTYKWGTVAPCIIATGGKTYIYYNVLTVSHNQIVTQASRVCNIMRVEIKFKSNSLKYKI